jgi:hypothetical protein
MAYPGDFVAANRAARTEAQHAAVHHSLWRVSSLYRACFQIWEWLAKRAPLRIYSRVPYWVHSP